MSQDCECNKLIFTRYTDTTHEIYVDGVCLENYPVFVTYRQKLVTVVLQYDSLSVECGEYEGTEEPYTKIEASLTQEQTAKFREGEVEVQVNWIIDGKRYASEIGIAYATKNNQTEVIRTNV